ncbi:MAG: Lrp/AsnC family transcriptional regulator [archaeon]
MTYHLSQLQMDVLGLLRADSRLSVAVIAKLLGVSVARVFSAVQFLERNVIKKHATLLDYSHLGNPVRVFYAISDIQVSGDLFIEVSPFINTHALAAEPGMLLIEAVFPSMAQMDSFEECLHDHSYRVFGRNMIVEDIVREQSFTARGDGYLSF